ncbi:hypothetical protein AVEN_199582-1 [Araneus ventricosus]|uniref:Uncharacterized protein n=1 Tax=Araneus ventricosus TaxID=182803 RepID=A0A4Y2V7B2_ARAVE|nr:hypothetical protein AVEN_78285-1 [Araneus ventricosus]GBO20430.1 hypothetical protein AVEN_168999-1 [Araneus ventricosus]GBO20431.1 hypothetical protein AVEN_176492-1 [Araneus ventricosus]GBO20434.1 hypothetical protein AVEN_199582-1 [Araneus ventricosus]
MRELFWLRPPSLELLSDDEDDTGASTPSTNFCTPAAGGILTLDGFNLNQAIHRELPWIRFARPRKGEWPDCVSASVHSSAAERFAKPRAIGTLRLFGIPPTTFRKYEPRATRGLISFTPSEQGLKPRTHDQITHRFRPRCALLTVVGTGRFDVARGLVRASVVSRVVAVNSSNIKDARTERCDPFPWPVVFCTLFSRPSFLAVSEGLWSRILN